jgi:uncharacterized protein (UPF0548 family)
MYKNRSRTPSWKKPSSEGTSEFLQTQARQDFSYREVGATAADLPSGYNIDRTRVVLGQGEEVFLAAKRAIKEWKQFGLGWVEAMPADTPIEPGKVVAVAGRAFGIWMLNSCRIVYVIDEHADGCVRFGFAYGTLPSHVEQGEEQFLVEWDQRDNRVWYSILAFSRPRHVLARLGFPIMRRLQKRFARESAVAMQRAVRSSAATD